MSTTPSTSTQWQEGGESNACKERKPATTPPVTAEFTRALSPASTKKNHTNVPENNGRTHPLSPPRAAPQAQREVTRSRPNHHDKNSPSGKSFIGKMEFIDTLIHEIDETVSN
jgi:hypothetical protein